MDSCAINSSGPAILVVASGEKIASPPMLPMNRLTPELPETWSPSTSRVNGLPPSRGLTNSPLTARVSTAHEPSRLNWCDLIALLHAEPPEHGEECRREIYEDEHRCREHGKKEEEPCGAKRHPSLFAGNSICKPGEPSGKRHDCQPQVGLGKPRSVFHSNDYGQVEKSTDKTDQTCHLQRDPSNKSGGIVHQPKS